MRCRRCGVQMKQLAHRAHGKIKFRCPQCGGHRMQNPTMKNRRARGRVRPED